MATAELDFADFKASSRNAADGLRRHVLNYLQNERPEPGTRIVTEAQIMSAIKLSRSTVRRALDPLEREGWIDRRPGAGTFVGSRVATWNAAGESHIRTDKSADFQLNARRSRGIVRVAVLIFNIGDLAHDWYTPGILEGMDEAGQEQKVIVELLGDRNGDVNAIAERLRLSRPDVLVVLSNQPRHGLVVRDAQNLGIACFVSGTPHQALGLPCVCEDNRQAITIAVGHLVSRGHKQIGLCLPRLAEPWVFERLDAFHQAIAGGKHRRAQPLVHWTESHSNVDASEAEAMLQFIKHNRLSAIIPAGAEPMRSLDFLARAGRISVPEDLSVISFEQDQVQRKYLGLANATRIRFPLREMGQVLAKMAKAVVEGSQPQSLTLLPAQLIEGDSVQSLLR